MKSVYDMEATKKVDVYVLLKDGEMAGRIVGVYGNAVTVTLTIFGKGGKTGRASGGGYDRFGAALMDCLAQIGYTYEQTKDIDSGNYDRFFDSIGYKLIHVL